ncbi:IucA/IucC family protein [Staphylococcus canis]|uniref:Siderophore synthetase n=1 Tax=Staphylococcus canis TaxID=2724942 RepID=A0ABS0TAV9_9STAP|nr:IucA/IucC family protein [Staphylococcus canis]MBI5975884.1 siderophore synthetase [Staphylococcus canis]
MSVNTQQADQNIQYRVFLACVKEGIFPDDVQIEIKDHSISVKRQSHLLQATFTTQSAFYQFDLTGPILYINPETQIEVSSLEMLLQYLEMHFDLEFHERLREELISSRQGLALSYAQYQARTAIHTYQFKHSNIEKRQNFIMWLSKYNQTNSGLGYTEGMIWEGHPSHPLTKTKLPLTSDEMKHYAPEFMKDIPLRIVLVDKHNLVETAMQQDDNFILNQVIPEYHTQLEEFIASYDKSLTQYRVMFVHPWQYDNVIVERFKADIAAHRIIPTPFHVQSKATLSFRTMQLQNKPFHVKLPVNVQATSAVRTVSTVTTVDGPKLSHQLQGLLEIYPSLKVATEPYGAYIDVDPDLARQFAMIIRHAPEERADALQLVTAALTQYNPVDGQVTVDSLIEYLYGKINRDTIYHFIRQFTERLVTPLIGYIQTYGIALEAHQQNTIVEVDLDTHDYRFIVRDLGGTRIDFNTLKIQIPDVEVTNTSLIADNIDDVIAKFQHAVIQNQLGTLIHHFHAHYDVSEVNMYSIVKEVVTHAIQDRQAHSEALKRILFGETVTVKALLNMRMQQKVKKYVQIQLDNPLKGEVS